MPPAQLGALDVGRKSGDKATKPIGDHIFVSAVHYALWVSAKGAVDDDLVQRALKEGELLIIELGDEQL